MAKKPQSKGKCFYCGNTYSKGGITKHLKTCTKRQEAIEALEKKSKAKAIDIFHLIVEDPYTPHYWLHLEVSAQQSLLLLDDFLRDIWLECCGHLSMFIIDNEQYHARAMEEYDDLPMSYRFGDLIDVGSEFDYEYDFGSTTALKLRVPDKRTGKPDKKIGVMARNFPPEILCQKCKEKPATLINIFSSDYENELWFCDDCAPEEDEEAYLYMPNVNSPRVGVCGYTGPLKEDKYAT